jgi:hypothetical protein
LHSSTHPFSVCTLFSSVDVGVVGAGSGKP